MNTRAIEAFAYGAMRALLAGSEDATATPRPRRRPRKERSATTAPPPFDPTIDAPGAGPDIPAPPMTQAQAEAMERVLRGEMPVGYYKPDEGVAPWMES